MGKAVFHPDIPDLTLKLERHITGMARHLTCCPAVRLRREAEEWGRSCSNIGLIKNRKTS